MNKLFWLISAALAFLIFAGCIHALFFQPAVVQDSFAPGISGQSVGSTPASPAYDRSIVLDTGLPPSPATVPFCHVVSVEKYSSGTGTALEIKKSIPPVAEAPGIAEKILEGYGGLPEGAVLERTDQMYMKKYNLATSEVEEEYPQYTRVVYSHYVNGSPILGSGISVSLGEDGQLLDISKDWSSLEFSGEVPVISAEEGWEKLNARELLQPIQGSLDGFHITRVQFGYHVRTHATYEYAWPVSLDTCTPVWIFYGIKPETGTDPFPLMVNATVA
jgi:hypothetical protein